jgi:hypothetical protein
MRAGASPRRPAAEPAAPDVASAIDIEREEAVPPLSYEEMLLVEALAERPELLEVVYREQIHLVIDNEPLSSFLEEASVRWVEDGTPEFGDAIESCSSANLRGRLQAALVAEHGLSPESCEEAFHDTVNGLKKRWTVAEIRRVSEEQLSEEDFERQLELQARQEQLLKYLSTFQGVSPH